jgi:hypothetical protein
VSSCVSPLFRLSRPKFDYIITSKITCCASRSADNVMPTRTLLESEYFFEDSNIFTRLESIFLGPTGVFLGLNIAN